MKYMSFMSINICTPDNNIPAYFYLLLAIEII